VSDTVIAANQALVEKLGVVGQVDSELNGSWRERRWGSFIRAWIMAVVISAAAGFIVPLVMLGIYTFITAVLMQSDGRGTPDLLSLCASIAALAGTITLIFTVPITALKSLQSPAVPRSAR
jgi:hypothetical protein